jgi:hypothetical protein
LVEHSLMEARRGGGQGSEVIHWLDLRYHLTALRIERIHGAAAIAKEDRRSTLRLADGDTRAQTGARLKAPNGCSRYRRRANRRRPSGSQ